ncbi:RHS repeat domain-containing protein [Massilia sp. DWR3-1-1]|uniref:RHS repeat domain-containing protein n=1 Tax=Massilia sp. DWR3-1-1 TaxID=2804559 RepID=UPI003CF3AFE4
MSLAFMSRAVMRRRLPMMGMSLLAALSLHASAWSQDVTTYDEQYKRIKAPRAYTQLGPDLFGDSVNLYNGSLSFTQTDVSLPGNSRLPVSIGRSVRVEPSMMGGRAFGLWDLEIPHIHGVFPKSIGWQSQGSNPALRCAQSSVIAPRGESNSYFEPDEFWQGTYLYVPGVGDQRILGRTSDTVALSGRSLSQFPAITSQFWLFSCTPSLDSDTTAGKTQGDGFVALSPDGTSYTFNWMADFPVTTLTKANPSYNAFNTGGAEALRASASRDTVAAVIPGTDATGGGPIFRLPRNEVWLLPTLVTDRFGNWVRYTYDPAHPRNLMSITSSESPSRTITLTYAGPDANGFMQVQTVSDGSRTWTYSYRDVSNLAAGTRRSLDRVTLPDGTAWDFSNMYGMLPGKLQVSTCTTQNMIPWSPNIGSTAHPVGAPSMVHPSGAIGSFALTPTTHGRSDVPPCGPNDDVPSIPNFFNSNSLNNKTVSGPGLPTMSWNYDYGPANASWSPCNNCVTSKTVTITDPAGEMTTHVFGNRYNVSEGRPEQVSVGGRTTTTLYQPFGAGPYPALMGYANDPSGDAEMAARLAPVNQRITSRQGATFTWTAGEFDEYAHPRLVTRTSSLNPGRSERTVFDNNIGRWIPGQTTSVTEINTNKVMVSNVINASTGLIESVSQFGHLNQSMTYNTDGTLLTKSDGLQHATRFDNWKRGIPRNISHPDGSTESAEVNNDGTLAWITDPMGLRTTLNYDSGGRLNRIVYPVAPGESGWNDTTLTLSQINGSEFDLPPGHWRQDVVTGNAVTSTFLDALFRPAYTWTYENNVATGQTMVKTEYDHAGRATFSSYPQRGYVSELSQGVRSYYYALGRPTEVRADSELGALSTYTSYNNGFTRTVVDPRGNSSTTSFQAFDTPSEESIAAIAAPEGLNVAINRDVFGKPTAITRSGTSPAGLYATATRSYVYDSYERLCKTIEPETGATVQQLDAANNVSWRAPGSTLTGAACDQASVPAAGKIVFGYDSMNRLTSTTYGDGSAAIGRDYWADGQPKTVSSSGALWTMNYNGRRLPTTQSLAFEGQTYTLRTDYNANGHPVQLAYPAATNAIANQSVSYDPDALGRPSHVGAYASAIGYHPSGAIAGFTYGNGKVRSMTQNTRGLPRLSQDGGVLQDVYDYDQNGNVTLITDQINAGPGGANTSRAMAYDGLDRLKDANAPGIWGNANYNYDVLDNIRTSTVGGRASTYHYGARNLLDNLQSTASGFNYAYGYDNRGNVTSRGGQGFGFDLGNRLTTAANLDTYVYDGFGRRIKTAAVDGTVTISVYSPAGQLLYTRRTGGPNPAQSTQYIYLHSHQIAEVKK